MKSVLISINPQRCELIAAGKKTVEARKTRPKLVLCGGARQWNMKSCA